jgi:hypothetical protein
VPKPDLARDRVWGAFQTSAADAAQCWGGAHYQFPRLNPSRAFGRGTRRTSTGEPVLVRLARRPGADATSQPPDAYGAGRQLLTSNLGEAPTRPEVRPQHSEFD